MLEQLRRLLVAVAIGGAMLLVASQPASAQTDCRWIGNGAALACSNAGSGLGPTVSTWQGTGWTTVPGGPDGGLGGWYGDLSTFGSSFPPSPVTPARSYSEVTRLGNTITQNSVRYGPGPAANSYACSTSFWGSAIYQTCR